MFFLQVTLADRFHPKKCGGFLSLHNDDTMVKIDGTGIH